MGNSSENDEDAHRRRDQLTVMICAPAAKRSTFRKGMRDGKGRERREDGADDHTNARKLGSLCGKQGGHSLPRRSRITIF
jgi:hypothetical protein